MCMRVFGCDRHSRLSFADIFSEIKSTPSHRITQRYWHHLFGLILMRERWGFLFPFLSIRCYSIYEFQFGIFQSVIRIHQSVWSDFVCEWVAKCCPEWIPNVYDYGYGFSFRCVNIFASTIINNHILRAPSELDHQRCYSSAGSNSSIKAHSSEINFDFFSTLMLRPLWYITPRKCDSSSSSHSRCH